MDQGEHDLLELVLTRSAKFNTRYAIVVWKEATSLDNSSPRHLTPPPKRSSLPPMGIESGGDASPQSKNQRGTSPQKL